MNEIIVDIKNNLIIQASQISTSTDVYAAQNSVKAYNKTISHILVKKTTADDYKKICSGQSLFLVDTLKNHLNSDHSNLSVR